MKKPISTPRNVAEYKALENRASRLSAVTRTPTKRLSLRQSPMRWNS